jgi:hypothetical protein
MISLPADIDIAQAKYPAVYEQAKIALASCEKLDECKEFADKAEAIASYAKMANDNGLRVIADRIQARAVRRMGELLKEVDGSTRNKDATAPVGDEGALITQKQVADAAGVSDHQRVQAVRVANVPEEKFEAAIEARKPATVTKLAEMGTRTRAKPTDEEPVAEGYLRFKKGTLYKRPNPPRITPEMEELARQHTKSVFHAPLPGKTSPSAKDEEVQDNDLSLCRLIELMIEKSKSGGEFSKRIPNDVIFSDRDLGKLLKALETLKSDMTARLRAAKDEAQTVETAPTAPESPVRLSNGTSRPAAAAREKTSFERLAGQTEVSLEAGIDETLGQRPSLNEANSLAQHNHDKRVKAGAAPAPEKPPTSPATPTDDGLDIPTFLDRRSELSS